MNSGIIKSPEFLKYKILKFEARYSIIPSPQMGKPVSCKESFSHDKNILGHAKFPSEEIFLKLPVCMELQCTFTICHPLLLGQNFPSKMLSAPGTSYSHNFKNI